MRNHIILIITSAFLLFLFVGCNNNQIMVDSAEPVVSHISSQVLDIRNCGTRNELRKSLSTEFQVAFHLTINNETTAADNVENSIPANLRKQLEKQIKATYKNIYEDAMKELDETILTIPGNEVRTYSINWEEKAYNSTIYLTTKEEIYTWSYTYSLDIPKLGEIYQSGCTA